LKARLVKLVNNKLEHKKTSSIKEKTQYGLTFGVIAMMLFVAGFPMVVIFFFGIFAYFLWKTFSATPQNGVRQIFEFYLSANAILRDDERTWFGFEVQEVIAQGERILRAMHGAPPLVYFSLGALYNKIENHEGAVKHLSFVVEDENAGESSYVHPSVDLRSYVRTLRKIEQEPTDAPKMAAAIRALERFRKNRSSVLLEESREKIRESNIERKRIAENRDSTFRQFSHSTDEHELLKSVTDKRVPEDELHISADDNSQTATRKPVHRGGQKKRHKEDDLYSDRKPITEVLHDIYDKNIQ